MRQKQGVFSLFLLSPSSRRAWIEIPVPLATSVKAFVALLAEGVDRNHSGVRYPLVIMTSPSSRRAWIEILHSLIHGAFRRRRPPRGGRG